MVLGGFGTSGVCANFMFGGLGCVFGRTGLRLDFADRTLVDARVQPVELQV